MNNEIENIKTQNRINSYLTIPNFLEFLIFPYIILILISSFISGDFYQITFSEWLSVVIVSFFGTVGIMSLIAKVYGYNDYRYKILIHILILCYAAAVVSLCSPGSGILGLLDNLDKIAEILVPYSFVVIPTVSTIVGSIMNIFNITDPFVVEFDRISSKVREGDFSVRITKQALVNDSVFGPITSLINEIIDNSANFLKKISEASQSISNSVELLSTTSIEVNSLTQEITTTIQQIAHGASQQSDISIKGLEDINNLSKLVDKSMQEISETSKVISEIAAQTNILALNAAIEAARAGESGRGFAVVADNVRRLAEETKNNSAEIGSVIEDIVKSVQDSVALIQELFQNFAAQSEEFSATSEEVSAATEEQYSLVEGMDNSVKKLTQLNSDFTDLVKRFNY